MKLVVSIGGDNIKSETFSLITSSAEGISNFTKGVAKFISKNDIDGVEIDWRWPSKQGGVKDKDDLTTLMKVLRLAIDDQVHKVSKREATAVKIGESIIERMKKGQDKTAKKTAKVIEGNESKKTEGDGVTEIPSLDIYDDYAFSATEEPEEHTTTESYLYDDYVYFGSDEIDAVTTTQKYESSEADR